MSDPFENSPGSSNRSHASSDPRQLGRASNQIEYPEADAAGFAKALKRLFATSSENEINGDQYQVSGRSPARRENSHR